MIQPSTRHVPPSPAASRPTTILIAGAGPTGLTLALTLRRFGVPARLIDRAPQPTAVSKALAIWSASLETMPGLGVIDDILAASTRLKALSIRDGDWPLATLQVGPGIDSPYPFPLLQPQSATERILTERLIALGGSVERHVELVGLTQDDDGVTVDLQHGDGRRETARVGTVIGCDGARSFVRHALGIEFAGYTEPQSFILGDVGIAAGPGRRRPLDRQTIYLSWRGDSTVALFPFAQSLWRIFAMRPAGAGDQPPPQEELQGQIDRHGPRGLRLHDPQWLSAFRVNERLAARYRLGRCFLAGDAAHIHSPAGGQGMNTGIQDAVNLGWKLAAVHQGIGDADLLLDSYEPERRPVARAVVDAAAQKLHLAFSTGRLTRLAKGLAVSLLGNLPAVQRRLQVELSETETRYRDGPLLAVAAAPPPVHRTDAGSRALDIRYLDPVTGDARWLWPLLSAPCHTLLRFVDADGADGGLADILAAAGDRLQLVVLDRRSDPRGLARIRYRFSGPGWVLIRPDLVIAARGDGNDFTGLRRYVDRVLRPAVPA